MRGAGFVLSSHSSSVRGVWYALASWGLLSYMPLHMWQPTCATLPTPKGGGGRWDFYGSPHPEGGVGGVGIFVAHLPEGGWGGVGIFMALPTPRGVVELLKSIS